MTNPIAHHSSNHGAYWSVLAIASVLLLPATACAPPATEETATKDTATEVGIEEIPVTTASDAAREMHDEGLYLLDVGRGVEAREKFQAAIAEDPGFVSAHFNQSNASLSFKEFQTCLDMASEHLENVSEGERMMVEINRTFLTNNTSQGLALAQDLVAKYTDSPRAHLTLAAMQTNHNDAAGARASLERAHALDSQSAGALFGIAANYLGNEPKDFVKAEEWAAKALAAYPKEAKGHELMGDIKRGQDDLEAALTSYDNASETDPTLANAHHKRGHVNSFLGNIEEARAAYDAGVDAAAPESKAGLAVYKTFTRIHQGDVPAALDELEALAGAIEGMGTPAH
ncbi:MAG: tetratricopeptide repeat protein, partial [Acidobacteriota bacterium]|nr:tetratricopeptide repeat protein [Acidobacteriota bacterium]